MRLPKYWIAKGMHPALLEMASLYKATIERIENYRRLFGSLPAKPINEIRESFRTEIEKLRVKYPDFSEPLSNEQKEIGFMAWLHLRRHGTSFWDDLRMRDTDFEAYKRVSQTEYDSTALHFGNGRPENFKGNLHHQEILGLGLGLGLKGLGADDLAEFFDTYCPCGKEGHDADSLKRHRARLGAKTWNPSEKETTEDRPIFSELVLNVSTVERRRKKEKAEYAD